MKHHLTKDVLSPSVTQRFWKYVSSGPLTSCWEWTGSRSPVYCGSLVRANGYGRIKIHDLDRGANYVEYAHRVSFVIHNGDIPKGLVVMHTCDNPPCCNPAHLVLGTYSDNSRDRNEKGRHPYMKKQYPYELIHLYESGYTLAELSGKFDLSTTSIRFFLLRSGVQTRKTGDQAIALREQNGIN